jgi:hypothetical protein
MGDRAVGHNSGTIPAKFGLIWFSGFRGEDLNVIKFDSNMRQVGGFLRVIQFPQPIRLTARI